MKLKRTIFVALSTFLLTTTVLAASDQITISLFKGKIVFNNKIVNLKQDVFNINGKVYVPIRAFAESMKGHVSYDKNNQTIYVDQSSPSDKKSTVNEKVKDDTFTLSAFATKATYTYGEPIELWSRISNHTEHTVNILHGASLLEYYITDEDGFTSDMIYDYNLDSSIFASGDEFNSSLNHNNFLVYNLNKNGILEKDQLQSYINETARPYNLPKGAYTITVKAQYWMDETSKDKKTLKVSIPIKIE